MDSGQLAIKMLEIAKELNAFGLMLIIVKEHESRVFTISRDEQTNDKLNSCSDDVLKIVTEALGGYVIKKVNSYGGKLYGN